MIASTEEFKGSNTPSRLAPWDPMNSRSFLKDSDEIQTGRNGGKQSAINAWPTEVPPAAVLEVADIMQKGARKYGSKNWWQISVKSELDHALKHIYSFLALNDVNLAAYPNPPADVTQLKEELGHAAARIMMALDQYLRCPELGDSE